MFYNQARQSLSSINNNPNEQPMAQPFSSDVHTHPCHFCKMVFKTAKALGDHIKDHERNLLVTPTISSVQQALQREELRKTAQRPTSSSSLAHTPTFGASTSVISPKSVPTPISFLASSSSNMQPKTDAKRINYHTRPFLDNAEKHLKIESDDLSEERRKRSEKGQEDESEKVDLTLRL
ncbi:hypothetical protein AQUCO_01700707v1 [Aquilegia coerulea]|uniref:C2H2-type domain-containing protein n=1 Tax=Aquilegia coerulea TaxID=218851 RepID=A0A2G5DPH2_AQUCA|nr:hypothetical protein AQUCO_01700707v1 [Aquilegia coerulea]